MLFLVGRYLQNFNKSGICGPDFLISKFDKLSSLMTARLLVNVSLILFTI